MVQVDRPSTIVQYIVDLLRTETNQHLLAINPEDVFYGDQELIPRTPAVAVESGPMNRVISGIGGKGRTDNTFRVFLMCYIASVQSVQITARQALEFAEKVMDVLHVDITLGGLVIHGHVTTIEPGYAIRSKTLMRAARISWDGLTKTMIV